LRRFDCKRDERRFSDSSAYVEMLDSTFRFESVFMRISKYVLALGAAMALSMLAGCTGGSSIAPMPASQHSGASSIVGGERGVVNSIVQPYVGVSAPARIRRIDLRSAAKFAVLAGSTVTNDGPTVVTGNLGLSPGSSVVGFPPGKVVDGSMHVADGAAAEAKHDLTTAYNDAAGRKFPHLLPSDIGGMTLSPGLYRAPTSLTITGNVTFDGKGDADSVFIIQVPTKLVLAVNSSITLIGNAKARNIFWQVGSSATLKKASVFKGIILAHQSISLGTGATVADGRLLARIGAVTLLRNIVTIPRT
jgi:hypothetical protein